MEPWITTALTVCLAAGGADAVRARVEPTGFTLRYEARTGSGGGYPQVGRPHPTASEGTLGGSSWGPPGENSTVPLLAARGNLTLRGSGRMKEEEEMDRGAEQQP